MAWTTPRTWTAGELVTATLLNTHLRDNLNALKALPAQGVNKTADTWTTSSTSFVSITGAEMEVTTAGGRLLIGVFGTFSANTTLVAAVSLLIDGTTRIGSATDGLQRINVPGSRVNGFGLTYLSSALSAANHTVALQVKTTTGSLGVPQWFIWVQEA